MKSKQFRRFGGSVRSLTVLAARTTVCAISAIQLAHAADPGDAAGSEPVQEVIVTGSLIAKPNDVASSPIVAISKSDLQQSGQTDVESMLNQLPEFTAGGTTATGGQGTGGHATVDLHGLGSNRNLVLLDGHRLPLADIYGDVDINLIPASILSGVETITGGASAIYGSDAISGVVNFKTIKDFEGIAADVQYGNSTRQDYGQVDTSFALGTIFAEHNGHNLLSFGYTYNEGLKGSARSFFDLQTPSSYIGQSTFVPSATNLPSQGAVNALFNGYGVGNVPNTLNLGFNNDGSLFTQTGAKNYKGPTTDGYAIIGGNVRMPVAPQGYIENPLNRRSIFDKFDYDLTPGISLYAQLLYVDWDVYTNSGNSLTQLNTLTTIPVTNPFIPAALATLLASRPNATAPFTWNGRYVGLPTKSWDEHYTTYQYLGGLRGDLPFRNWSWDVYTAYDATDHLQSMNNAVLKSQVQNLLNAADGGNSLCAGGFDPFGLNHSSSISAACQNYMTTTAHAHEQTSQAQVQGVLQGSIFKLPAGDVSLALLGDHRSNDYKFTPDPEDAAGNIEAFVASQPTKGSISVSEFATQLDIPLLHDVFLAKDLDLGGAFRHSDYNISGGVNTFAYDLKWTPVSGVLTRAGFERAVRAPNIGELYSAAAGSQVAIGTPPASIGDPCDIRSSARTGANSASVIALCEATGVPAAVINTYEFPTTATGGLSSGNTGLTPETASTYNFGVVWTSTAQSPWLSDTSFSADYFHIGITHVISVIPGLTALGKCYDEDGSNPTFSSANPYCQLIQRDPSTGNLVQILTPYLNLGGLKTSGIDFQLNWSAHLNDLGLRGVPGQVHLSSNIGFTESYAVSTLPGTPFTEYVGTNTVDAGTNSLGASFPRWKALTTLSYEVGSATVGVRWHYQDAMNDVSYVTNPTHPSAGVGTYSLYDLFGTWTFYKTWQFRAGITNLANVGLPVVASSQNGTDVSVFDPVGRSYYVGVHVKL